MQLLNLGNFSSNESRRVCSYYDR